ncbi:hypothetical protein CDD81_2903 [Ophiocordyceps australis]|uniref:DJ-1/PfpI domain-containing protein n=1 Tax=Ophiocordyceps australis TaxID=1399860 RepID=A0A2C5YJG6_9HYPO|nr:hypothetical protein CDD81_2903 [Ophiocordyceps australis]
MAQPFDLSKPNRTIRVGVILMGGRTEALDVAPVDMIHSITKGFVDELPAQWLPMDIRSQAIDAEFLWVSEAGKSTTSKLTSAMSIVATNSFDDCPPLDVVMIGAHNFSYEPTEKELAFVRKSWENCSAFLAICGGIEVAVLAGIVGSKTATAPRFALDPLRQRVPEARWVNKRWERDGKLWTSGTLLNGLDLTSAFIQETWGKGEGSLVDYTIKLCAWPIRDQEYRDVSWLF